MEQPSDFLKGRLAKLPHPLPTTSVKEDVQDDTTDTSTETDSSTASIQTIVPTANTNDTDFVPPAPKLFARPSEPVSWTKYFRENFKVTSTTDSSITFNVYYSPPATPTAPVYVVHHGAGSSGLSFALVAQHLTTAISCGLIAFDVRYLETLAQDQVDIVHGVSKHASWESRDGGWPDLILVGHRYPPPRKLRVIVVLEEQCRHILRRMGFFQRYVYVSLTW
jgi:protein phosphatase methylesterase 1